MKQRYRHIHFTKESTMEVDAKPMWFCRNNKTHDILGTITWYGPWRRYVFEAEPGGVFDHACLLDIADFLQNQLSLGE